MTNEHPITPPPELVFQWCAHSNEHENYDQFWRHIATQAARWGADQELEACISYFHEYDASWGEFSELISGLRTIRRPKPPSLKEEALAVLRNADGADYPVPVLVLPADEAAIIRRAIEALPDNS